MSILASVLKSFPNLTAALEDECPVEVASQSDGTVAYLAWGHLDPGIFAHVCNAKFAECRWSAGDVRHLWMRRNGDRLDSCSEGEGAEAVTLAMAVRVYVRTSKP